MIGEKVRKIRRKEWIQRRTNNIKRRIWLSRKKKGMKDDEGKKKKEDEILKYKNETKPMKTK